MADSEFTKSAPVCFFLFFLGGGVNYKDLGSYSRTSYDISKTSI